MYSFQNDYNEIAHPRVMQVLNDLVGKRFDGYSTDKYTQQITENIKQRIGRNDADLHFFNGGTITNLTAISHVLRPHQAVIAVDSGHIATHETGAIEATGHKVITVSSGSGKFTDDLFFELGKYVNDKAQQLVSLFEQKGFSFLAPPESNQIFVILPNQLAKKLMAHYALRKICEPNDGVSCLRLCTSWSTTQQDVDKFITTFNQLL
ncbi:beta-eliminating lyase-related protein [Providencia stuartii]|uniref:beta-eliminating lyase-related protein n=1 Tax=Providencia stuartii TaxID=588 RepID=UPI00300D6C79